MPGLSFDRPILLLLYPLILAALGGVEWLTSRQMRLASRGRRTASRGPSRATGANRRQKDGRARSALGIRLVVLLLVVLALAGLRLSSGIQREAVVFDADLSRSVRGETPAEAAWIRRAIASRHAGDLAGIVVTGRDPLAEQPVSADPHFTSFQSVPDDNWTNLAGSLSLAAAMLPANARRRVVLLSDGQQNLGDAVQQARVLRAEGIVVDTVAIAPPTSPEVRIDSLSVPDAVGQGERFSLSVRLVSNVAEPVTLRLFVDGAPVERWVESIQQGEQRLDLSLTAPEAGLHHYRVELDATEDTIPQNNVGEAVLRVTGPPRVLIAEGTAGDGRNLSTALAAGGFTVTTLSATTLPRTAAGLADYSAIVLVDVPARALGIDRMAALQAFVRDLGRGLLVIGGENSYGPGAYADTPLEATLPVTMEIPQRQQIPTVAVALIVENLENPAGNDTAKEAAKKVVLQLTPRDEVMVSDAAAGFPVPLQHVPDPTAIAWTIDHLQTGDPASYAPYLSAAANALSGSTARVKHIILVGDGDAQDDYRPLIEQIVARGITVSAVATAAHHFADASTMQAIARWGHGRYYEATDFTVPRALLKEAHTVIRPAVIQDRFRPRPLGTSPLLVGPRSIPALDGYVATTPRPLASLSLLSDEGDPILASWQYGLGRSIAWTSDANGLWTNDFIRWPGAARFWTRLVEWLLPPAGDPGWHLGIRMDGPLARVVVESLPSARAPSQLTAHLIGPDGTSSDQPLVAVAPGRYAGSFLTEAPGAYVFQVSGQAGQASPSLTGSLVVPYSPEYRTVGVNRALLEQIAREGGGKVIDDPAGAFADDLPPVTGRIPIWRWLLWLAAALLVIDVAVRRLNPDFAFSGRDLEPAIELVRQLSQLTLHGQISGPASSPRTGPPPPPPVNPPAPVPGPRPSSQHSAHSEPATTGDAERTTAEIPLHTSRLLAARRKRSGQHEPPDSGPGH